MVNRVKLQNILLKIASILFLTNRCSFCKDKLQIDEMGLCSNCFFNLKSVSIKEEKNIFYLWNISKDNYSLYLALKKKRGSTYLKLKEIIDDRREKALKIDRNKELIPFYSKIKIRQKYLK